MFENLILNKYKNCYTKVSIETYLLKQLKFRQSETQIKWNNLLLYGI